MRLVLNWMWERWTYSVAQFSTSLTLLKQSLAYPNWELGSTHGKDGRLYRMGLIAMVLPLLAIFSMSLLLRIMEQEAWGLMSYMRRKWLGMPWHG